MVKATIRIGFLIAILNLSIGIAAARDITEPLVSPDGALEAKINFADGEYRLAIKNGSGSPIEKIKTTEGLPLEMKWSGDSRSLVIVEHLAGGSGAEVIYRKGTEWISFRADPLLESRASYSVAEVANKGPDLRFTYKIAYEKANGEVTHYGLYRFTVNLKTGKRSDVVTSPMDFASYQALSLKFIGTDGN